jgi:hypothetical protein
MCQLCEELGISLNDVKPAPSAESRRIEKNDDGTYTLTLTEKELTNLMIRLALSVVNERQS